MDQSVISMKEFETRSHASQAAAQILAGALIEDLSGQGQASFLSSGGSSPIELLEMLSERELDWQNITVGLVDERCVPADHAASNAGLVKRHLLKNFAADAEFLPMFSDAQGCFDQAISATQRYSELTVPSALLLGMGTDGHTASWFPGAQNVSAAMGETDQAVVQIDARGCPGAGNITDRLTLTRSAVARAKCVVLLIFGQEKRSVLLNAQLQSANEMPILSAIEDLGDRLITVWAP